MPFRLVNRAKPFQTVLEVAKIHISLISYLESKATESEHNLSGVHIDAVTRH